MSPQLEAWKTSTSELSEEERAFEKWMVVTVAGVLFAGKAGELLVLTCGQFGLSIDRQIERMEAFSRSWGLSMMVLCRACGNARVVVYRANRVREILSEVPRWAFEEMGYPPDIGPNRFIEEVGRRWREGLGMPHEIGFSLGYPVKDVLGYMALVPLPCTGNCGWRIYGDPDPSLRRSEAFREAREQAATFLSM
jgi:hypothetical protein